MEGRARLGWLINDLHRHAVPYWVAHSMPALLRMNRLMRQDAAISVARAFMRPDWERLLEVVPLPGAAASVRWCFPWRYAVGRIKPP